MKFYGVIGFGETRETRPGIWQQVIEERSYFGDVLRDSGSFSSEEKVNDDFTLNNQISIISDTYALNNFGFMRYIVYGGVKWKITGVEVKYPRLLLHMGGVWNDQQPT